MQSSTSILVIVLSFIIGVAGIGYKLYNGEFRGDEAMNNSAIVYKKISPDEAKRQIDADKNIILLDVRTDEEYNEKHIPNSILIPVDNIENEVEKKLPDKTQKIFVYCRSGRRSAVAVQTMIGLGYAAVYDMGGILDWKYEVE